MSEEKRESELDINELLRKYLPDEAQDGDESTAPAGGDAAPKPQPRRRRTAARRAPEGAKEAAASDEKAAPAPDASGDTLKIDARDDMPTGVFTFDDEQKRSYEPDASAFSAYGDGEASESYDYIDEEAKSSDADGEKPDGAVDDGAEETETGVDDGGEGSGDELNIDDESLYDLGLGGDDTDVDPFDMNILLGLGMEEELEQAVGAEKVSRFVEKQQDDLHRTESLNRERAELSYEYTAKSQTREVVEMYNGAYRASKIRLIAAVVLTLILFVFECHSMFGIELGGAFDPETYPVVFIMAGLQITFIIAALSYKAIFSGLRDFLRGRPTPECISGFSLIFVTLYDIAISFTKAGGFGDTGLETFHLPVAVGLLMMYAYQLLNVRREIYSFGVISSRKKKFALTSLSMAESQLEHEAFSDLMEEDDRAEDISVLKVEGADFVGDYFLRTNRYPGGRKFIGFIIPCVLVVAAVFFASTYNGEYAFYDGLHSAIAAALMGLPISVFYMFSHPFYRAVSKAREDECTIVGEGSVEEYADAAIISFDDKNVFPSTGVNVRGINVFGNNRIDRVLYYAASVFCTVGGPLADVFDLATRDIGHSDDVMLGRCLPGLLETTVDGKNVIFGSIDALEGIGIRIPKPLLAHRNDEFGDSVSVMYMVQDGRFVSRMLIQYLVDADFEFILRQLDRGGMFVGIKTFDPNVTEQFLGKQIKLKHYPVRVIRCKSLDDRTVIADTTVSGLISKDSPKSLLQTVTLCEKVLHARSINTMLVIISALISVFVSILAILFEALPLTPLFIALYQLFWIVPMFVASKMIVS